MKLPITIVIPVKNEEKNLEDCLRSVAWAEKVFVVDSNSQDRTPEICRDFGVEYVNFVYDGGWPKKKNWAIKHLNITTEWIFILDADERVTESLKDEIALAIKEVDVEGFYVRWKFVFLGRWMRHSWSHGWMLRLFRKDSGEYEDLGMRGEGGWDNEVHENIVIEGKTCCLEAHLLHESNESLSFWIKKQNEFSDWNAKRRIQQLSGSRFLPGQIFSNDPLVRRKAMKAIYLRLPLKPVWMFSYLYLIKFGFLDGVEGFYFCMLRAIHEFNIGAKVFEKTKVERRKSKQS